MLMPWLMEAYILRYNVETLKEVASDNANITTTVNNFMPGLISGMPVQKSSQSEY